MEKELNGLIKEKESKYKIDFIPPIFLERVAKRLEYGANKYGDGTKEGLNYGKVSAREYGNAISRHIIQYLNGDNGEDHLAAVAAGVAIIMTLDGDKV